MTQDPGSVLLPKLLYLLPYADDDGSEIQGPTPYMLEKFRYDYPLIMSISWPQGWEVTTCHGLLPLETLN